jgi:hypothetical protein
MVLLLLYSELSALQRSCWCSISHLGSLQLEGTSHDSWCTSRHVTACHGSQHVTRQVNRLRSCARAATCAARFFKAPRRSSAWKHRRTKNFRRTSRLESVAFSFREGLKMMKKTMKSQCVELFTAMPRLCLGYALNLPPRPEKDLTAKPRWKKLRWQWPKGVML